MSTPYAPYQPRRRIGSLASTADDFTNWLLFGEETWLVAVLKGVPLFLFMYFILFYISNYVYYLVTVEIPFLRFSDDVGFLIANGVGMGNFVLILVLALAAQASRGRRGFGWALIRFIVLGNFLLTLLLIIPLMAFNLAGGSFIPPRFPLQSLGFGVLVAGLGAMTIVYLWFEFRRITRREAEAAARRSAAYSRG